MELDMTKGSPFKLLVKFMIPLVIGNIVQQCYSMTDTILVGNLVGMNALAAVGATGTIMFLIFGFIQGITAGFTVLTSQRFGAGDYEAMRKSVGSAIVLSALVVIVATVVSLCSMDWLLQLLNTPEDIYSDAKTYIVIITLGIFAIVLYNMSAGILRAIGNSKVPLYFLVISAILNILLDVLFIQTFQWGIAGAAWATVISQGISGALCVLYIIKKVPLLCLKWEHYRLEREVVGIQFRIGVPMALQFSITALGGMAVQSVLNSFGTVAVAAYTAASKVEQLVTQPFVAFGVTMATYAAQNKGLNQITRIRKGVNSAFVMSNGYAIVSAIFAILMMPIMLQLFVREDYAIILPYAQTYIMATGVFFIPLGAIFIFRNSLQGCGYGVIPMLGGAVEMVSRTVIAIIAASMVSYTGVCLAGGITWVITSVYLWICYRVIMKKEATLENCVVEQVV